MHAGCFLGGWSVRTAIRFTGLTANGYRRSLVRPPHARLNRRRLSERPASPISVNIRPPKHPPARGSRRWTGRVVRFGRGGRGGRFGRSCGSGGDGGRGGVSRAGESDGAGRAVCVAGGPGGDQSSGAEYWGQGVPCLGQWTPKGGQTARRSGSMGPVVGSRGPVIRVKGSIMPPTGFEHASPDNGYPRKSVALTTKLRGLMC